MRKTIQITLMILNMVCISGVMSAHAQQSTLSSLFNLKPVQQTQQQVQSRTVTDSQGRTWRVTPLNGLVDIRQLGVGVIQVENGNYFHCVLTNNGQMTSNFKPY